ncbi:type I secretion system permease/ATPase [Paenacidovorax monticola]|uniref:Cyclolysin secretion/processing ATP-binding protein CyaB n=2 Tax=Paenacidovorax monticola TaxID=1926868 RepID=A0A7H0HBD3_9BURK|nr:type I secretion system permease/ATPase [Paenacidovorax monticola]
MFAGGDELGRGMDSVADRSDELLDCLLIVARAHGETLTRDAVMAGLPVEHARLTPGLLARAARRARLSCQMVRRPVAQLNDALLPSIVLLQGERACVLLGWNADRTLAQVVYPELPDSAVVVDRQALEADYLGSAAYLRPITRFDARAPEVRSGRHSHWFWSVIAENRSLYRDVLLAALLANLFALGMPIFIRIVYDRVISNNATDTLWMLAFGMLMVLVGDLSLRVLRGRFVDLASSRADIKLSAHIMERVLGVRMEQRPVSAGSFASSLRSFESVRDFIGSATVIAFIDLPFALIFMAVIAWISPPMLIPLLVGGAAMLLYALAVQGRMHQLADTAHRAGAQRNATLIEGLVGIETLKTLNAESSIQRKWESSVALLARVGVQLRLLSTSATQGSAFVQQMISLAIVIIGVYMIAEKELTIGGLIACTMLASRAMVPVGQVAGLLVQYHTASTALASLDEIMKREVERPEDAAFISRGALRGAIEFREVSFTYPAQETPSLRKVSLTIQPGEHVAILGRVGSGKTTLERLMLGLYRPTEGAVLIDGIDMRQLDPAELRRQMGYVQQDVVLFYGTLRENLTLGAPLADDAAVVKAAEIAGLSDLVNNHPRGFDMLVGERGESLSGGQRQGVAIGRAVINDPPVLVLDEPTSSMDHSSEEELKRRLGTFCRGKTLVLVSHRVSLLDLVDRIIVMDGGCVVADGTKEHVIAALRQGRIGKAA